MMVNVYVVIQESTDDCSYYLRDFADVFGSWWAASDYISKRPKTIRDEFVIVKKTIKSE